MRAGVLAIGLCCGCLAAPPDSSGAGDGADADGGAPPADAPALHCVSGSQLDLVHVNRVALESWGGTVTLSGMAVLVNPGEDTILLAGFSAAPDGETPGVTSSASISGGEGGIMLSPHEAKGQLSVESATILLPTFVETWADSEKPTLGTGFVPIAEEYPDEPSLEIPVNFEVTAGEYSFPIVVTLVPDEGYLSGTPLAAARVSATCP